MTPLPRREFLRRSAHCLGAVSALGVLPAVIQKALAIAPNSETGSIKDVGHVVILMQENRSFDHYFGTLRGVRGFGDRFPVPLPGGKPVWRQSDGTNEIQPFHLDSEKANALLVQDTPHNFSDAQAAWAQGSFGHWPLYKTPISMGHYRREDIPFQFALAEAFTLCDAYHCSLAACTDPNRIVLFSGSNCDPTMARSGVNCTDQDAEVVNHRCYVHGALPDPGYTFRGEGFRWPTLMELLEQAGVSWRIYQDPNDNWDGLMHGGLAFDSFRQATSGTPLYENGMKRWTLDDLRQHVLEGTLPAVSWILPSKLQSEHPIADSSPTRGGAFTAQVLEALTADSGSWSKTVMFLTFDENDGFFDHAPPPAVPSYNADGTRAGLSTVPVDGEYFSDPDATHRIPSDTVGGTLRPWGLGARVPMYVISPWSRGGWVNSQVYDHTSVGMFLEQRFGIRVDSISPWRRAVCGDLTGAFDFTTPGDTSWPTLPDVTNYAQIEAQQRLQPAARPPATPDAPFQEPGTRPSRALPYELHTSARTTADGTLMLLFANSGQQGAVFHVYDRLHLDRIPRRYTVEAAKQLSDTWNILEADSGDYSLWVYGPGGFVRAFEGNPASTQAYGFNPEVQICYDGVDGLLFLKVHNTGPTMGSVQVVDNAYGHGGPWNVVVQGNSVSSLSWDLAASSYWYDFTVTGNTFSRRLAGRMETGAHGISDPAMGV